MRNLRTAGTRSDSVADTSAEKVELLQSTIERVIRGKPEVVRLALVTLLAGGHLLIEDVPGVGKTTLAQALARSLDCTFQRIQFTSDLLPSDVIGLSIYNQHDSLFSGSRVRYSRMSCWLTRSIAPLQRPSQRSLRPWPKGT